MSRSYIPDASGFAHRPSAGAGALAGAGQSMMDVARILHEDYWHKKKFDQDERRIAGDQAHKQAMSEYYGSHAENERQRVLGGLAGGRGYNPKARSAQDAADRLPSDDAPELPEPRPEQVSSAESLAPPMMAADDSEMSDANNDVRRPGAVTTAAPAAKPAASPIPMPQAQARDYSTVPQARNLDAVPMPASKPLGHREDPRFAEARAQGEAFRGDVGRVKQHGSIYLHHVTNLGIMEHDMQVLQKQADAQFQHTMHLQEKANMKNPDEAAAVEAEKQKYYAMAQEIDKIGQEKEQHLSQGHGRAQEAAGQLIAAGIDPKELRGPNGQQILNAIGVKATPEFWDAMRLPGQYNQEGQELQTPAFDEVRDDRLSDPKLIRQRRQNNAEGRQPGAGQQSEEMKSMMKDDFQHKGHRPEALPKKSQRLYR